MVIVKTFIFSKVSKVLHSYTRGPNAFTGSFVPGVPAENTHTHAGPGETYYKRQAYRGWGGGGSKVAGMSLRTAMSP